MVHLTRSEANTTPWLSSRLTKEIGVLKCSSQPIALRMVHSAEMIARSVNFLRVRWQKSRGVGARESFSQYLALMKMHAIDSS